MGYRPGPKRRSYIPKAGSAKGRPLGISNLEDKIVEAATKQTLEPIYEAVFEDSSYGYRPGRSQHQCLDALGRFAREDAQKRGAKPEEFTFLGFTHYCGKTAGGYFKVKRRTSRKKLGQSLRKFSEWASKARNVLRKGEMLRQARTRVVGHLRYYAITDNSERCRSYVYWTKRLLFKWLNRKSQRRAYTWDSFATALAGVDWPVPRICKDLNPCRRSEAF